MKKAKYLQIFNYLLEFSKLRSNPIRDIESSETQYPDIVWFSNIPQCEIFDCITFPDYNQDADYWIKINKPKVESQPPIFPKLSETLSEWVINDSLVDENGTPTLHESIVIRGKPLLLSEQPQIEREFQKYLNDKWIDDLDLFKKETEKYNIVLAEYERQNKTYKDFFHIHNKAQHFGEEYELVIGVGLLHFQESVDTPLICRHIFTSKAEISFESSQRESFVKVSPGIENEIQIETDAILDLYNQFDSIDIIDAEKKASDFIKEKNISDNPFDINIKDAIQIFADRLRTDAEAKDSLSKAGKCSTKPTIYYAPALLLRKRNTRSFTALYEKIIQNISSSDETVDIPSINDIIGFFQQSDDYVDGSESNISTSLNDETIYFPKKYNDEQIEIIEKARRNSKVLVQGPPGTGKSHTIANLICHLLANGKKVLVTAYTKRALEVLKKQLPDDFKNLSVNLLSGDSSSIQDLDASVNEINDKLSSINLNSFKNSIEELGSEFSLVKKEKAFTKNEWLKVKEKATRKQNINKNYQGTLSEVAEKIEKEISAFTWFKDDFTNINKIGLKADIEIFISLTKYYQSIDCTHFNLIIPQKDKLPSLDELKKYKEFINDLLQKDSSHEEHILITGKDFPELKGQLGALHKLLLEIEFNDFPFKAKIKRDYRNNLAVWKDKLTVTRKLLAELPDDKLKQFDRSVEIKYPPGKTLKQLKSDAETLLKLAIDGKRLRGILSIFNNPLTPINIKQKQYFIKGVQVNGSDCDTVAEFETVLADIKIKQDFEELESVWEIQSNISPKSYFDKLNFFKQQKDGTEAILYIIGEAFKIKALIETVSSIRIQGFESEDVSELIDEVDYNYLLMQIREFKEIIWNANKNLLLVNIHPIAGSISESIANIEVDKYEEHLLKIDILNSEKEKYNNYRELQDNIKQYLPILVKEILDNVFDFNNLHQFENGTYLKHALAEVSKLLEDNYEEELTYKLADLERREERLISEIASMKAWLFVLDGLNKNFLLRQHLQAWVQAVKKIGKTGIGKRALKFRKEAQHQMEKCKDSVPCWVMPLYKVAETINPEQGMYDYVIIDEASQLGADAIFLLYISKNIIIVGDDKQTSPEYVGVDANTMTPHINRHLQNIPFANYYGTEFSFFDHAKRFCNGITVLREHFRCMPEIIEFCNKHFYAPEGKGLYPLKQYSENRIEPLMKIYCENGYTDGTYQNITNKPEAESIADKIAELVDDEDYKGKTFGVIALQGNKQGNLIDNLILKRIGEVEYKKRNIVCGNSASFQGDERDIMFLSLVTAHNHRRAPLVKPEDERRFNVAVSRAKEQLWLFHSVQLEDLSNTNDLRYKLLDHFVNYKQQPLPPQRIFERTFGMQPEPFESWFEVDVFNDLVTNNYNVIPQYEVAKGRYRIDLVTILSNGVKIAIECDGDKFHGAEQFQNDLLRQKVLERCGWQFFRVRGGEYYSNRKKALEPLWKLLRANNLPIPEVPISKEHQQHGDNGMKNHIVEEGLPETKSQHLAQNHNNKFEQPDLFRPESQRVIDFSTEAKKHTDNRIKIAHNLLSFPEFLVFTSKQNVYKIQNRGFNKDEQVIEQIEFEAGEKPIYLTGTKNYSGYLIVAFENGKAGKIFLTSYQTEHNRKKLRNAFADESNLIFIEHFENDVDLIALSSINKVVLFNTIKINPVDSRSTKGVQVMKSKDGSVMKKVKKLNQVKLNDPEYYRKDESLNVVGYYLKQGDEI